MEGSSEPFTPVCIWACTITSLLTGTEPCVLSIQPKFIACVAFPGRATAGGATCTHQKTYGQHNEHKKAMHH